MKTGAEFLDRCGRSPAPAVVANAWPLVHRTHRPGEPSFDQIATRGGLEARKAGSAMEELRGRDPAVYLFVGSGAYPWGLVAFLFEPALVSVLPCTLTPFDSGGLGKGRFVHVGVPLDVYDAWCVQGACLPEVLPHYVSALFDEPTSYVTRLSGDPDRPAPHGITSANGFAGAWTIEIQVQADVPIDAQCREIVFARRSIALRAPVAWVARARRASELEPSEEEFAETLAAAILRGA